MVAAEFGCPMQWILPSLKEKRKRQIVAAIWSTNKWAVVQTYDVRMWVKTNFGIKKKCEFKSVILEEVDGIKPIVRICNFLNYIF